MPISQWPEAERPREKLLAQGAANLSDSELLAIFLRTGVKGKSAVDLARELILGFGGLRSILEADHFSFCAHLGLGPAKYAQLQAVLEMARRHLAERMVRGVTLNEPQLIRQYLQAKLRCHDQEVFACVYVDSRNRMLAYQTHFFGSINCAAVYPRQLVKTALRYNAAGIILAHNHPSGNPEPSDADRAITARVRAAMELIDVEVLDHVVVGDDEVVSLAERGWL